MILPGGKLPRRHTICPTCGARSARIANKPSPQALLDTIFPRNWGAKVVISHLQIETLLVKGCEGLRRGGPMTRTEKRALAGTVAWVHAINYLARLGVDLATEPLMNVTFKNGGTRIWVQLETKLGVREYPLDYLIARTREQVEADAGGNELRTT
jgi:hypothetical protein